MKDRKLPKGGFFVFNIFAEKFLFYMKSLCVKCNRPTNQQVVAETRVNYGEPDDWWESHKYQIIQCAGCDAVTFRILSDDASTQYEERYEDWSQKLYPMRTTNSLPIKNLLNTPFNVIKIYKETIDAYNNNQVILCAAGLRAIIEGISINKSIIQGEILKDGKKRISKNLDGKIEGLSAAGYITSSHASILHQLRFIGNSAIHELDPPSVDELKIAINIIEHCLNEIYEIHHTADRLRVETHKRKK